MHPREEKTMRLVKLMLLAAAIGLGSTVPAQAQARGGMGPACAGSSANGSSAMSMRSPAGFSAFNGNSSMMTDGSNPGIGPSSMMAMGFRPNLNFAASNGVFGGFNTNAFAQGSSGFAGFSNVFGTGAMSASAAGPMVWNDGFNNGFSMGVMTAQNNGLASRNKSNAVGNDPTEPDAAAMTAAPARSATNAIALRMRTTPKRSKPRAKSVRSLSQSR
jgi:hypothetical protein